MIKIEKGVPIPPKVGPCETLYPFVDMQSGDSFAIAVPDGKTVKSLRMLLTSRAAAWAKRHAPGTKFTTRIEDGDKAVRIWMLIKPASLAPLSVTNLPVAKAHKIEDDPDPPGRRRAARAEREQFAHPIPSFADGGKPRAIKGSRY